MRVHLRKCDWIVLVIAALCIISSIVTWSIFPSVYKSQVKSHLQFEQNKDMSYGYSTWMFSHPPMTNIMKFYFFNVTNVDEMTYNGAKPMLNEVGPFAVIESEEKRYMKWNDDKTQVFYENYKKYIVHNEYSCDGCSFNQYVTVPNPTQIGAAYAIYDPQYGVTEHGRVLISTGLLLMGEYPFVTVKVQDILFDGYVDALLSAAHSNLMYALNGILNEGKSILPIPVPDMPRMGFFQGYNNTQDEHYWVRTGVDDVNRLGEVMSWADITSLPDSWWTTDYARSIRGSDSGSFSKMDLKKTDKIPMFQSFQCRSFDATYRKDETIKNIPSYVFSVPYDQYDTTSEVNKGFRYRNFEKVNYYPDWPNCPKYNPQACVNAKRVDCTVTENLCNNCCKGSLVNDTYLIPPGLFPLVCYPGRLQPSPFSVMFSPPHFLYSPPEVIDSVYGLNPSTEDHLPMQYYHEPFSGTVTRVKYRLMVSMPIMATPIVISNGHLPDKIVPMFWQGADALLHDNTYSLIHLGFVVVPKIVDAIKYGLLALGLLLVAFLVMWRLRTYRRNKVY